MEFPIGFVSDKEIAAEIIRILKFEGIVCHQTLNEGRIILYVNDEIDLPRAMEVYSIVTGIGSRTRPGEEVERQKFPLGIVSMCFIGVSVLTSLLYFNPDWHHLMNYIFIDRTGKEMFTHVGRGEIWRLISPVFLHFGMLHIFFNCLWMKDLGSLVELGMGHARFLVFALIAGITSNILQYYVGGPNFGGLSGIVYGLLGLVVCMKSFDQNFPFGLPKMDMILMCVWYVLCLVGTFGPIANMAHGGGLLIGVVYGVYYGAFKKRQHIKKALSFVAGAACLLIFTAGVEYVKMQGNFYFQIVPFTP